MSETTPQPTLPMPAKEDDVAALVQMATLAEKAERYEDMCFYLAKVVKIHSKNKTELKEEERNFLSVAFKNVVGNLRSSWRNLTQNSSNSQGGNSGFKKEEKKKICDGYSQCVKEQLLKKCQEVVDLLSENVAIVNSKDKADQDVFFLKMKGDYYRYMAEVEPEQPNLKDGERSHGENAKNAYKQAFDIAEKGLASTHPTRLGLALNFSVCHFEILKQHEEACKIAKKAFDEAIQKLDTLNDATYKDSTLIMQLLRDNLTLWTSEQNNDQESTTDMNGKKVVEKQVD